MSDFRFQVLKFDGVVQVSMTVEMADALMEQLELSKSVDRHPHLFAFSRQLRDIVRTTKRSLIPNMRARDGDVQKREREEWEDLTDEERGRDDIPHPEDADNPEWRKDDIESERDVE